MVKWTTGYRIGPGVVPSDYLKVAGAPMMCFAQGSQANVVNCTTSAKTGESQQDKIWNIDSTIESKPTPDPTTPATDSPTNDPVEDSIITEDAPEVFLKDSPLELTDYISSENDLSLNFKSLTSKICGIKKNSSESIFFKGGTCKIRASAVSSDPQITSPEDVIFTFTIKANVANKLTCVKGDSVAVISGKNPKCPTGYKKK